MKVRWHASIVVGAATTGSQAVECVVVDVHISKSGEILPNGNSLWGQRMRENCIFTIRIGKTTGLEQLITSFYSLILDFKVMLMKMYSRTVSENCATFEHK